MPKAHVDIELRWGDQDAYGHVNNVAYARYLEEARVRLFWTDQVRENTGLAGHFRDDTAGDTMMLVASQQIEFLRVLDYSAGTIEIALWIGKLGGSSLEVHYEIFDKSGAQPRLVARAITTVVIVNSTTMQPQRLSAAGRQAAQNWQDAPLSLR